MEKSDKRVAMERDIGYESETELNGNVMTDATPMPFGEIRGI